MFKVEYIWFSFFSCYFPISLIVLSLVPPLGIPHIFPFYFCIICMYVVILYYAYEKAWYLAFRIIVISSSNHFPESDTFVFLWRIYIYISIFLSIHHAYIYGHVGWLHFYIRTLVSMCIQVSLWYDDWNSVRHILKCGVAATANTELEF